MLLIIIVEMKFLILSLGLASVLVSGSSIACTGSSMCTWPIGGNPLVQSLLSYSFFLECVY